LAPGTHLTAKALASRTPVLPSYLFCCKFAGSIFWSRNLLRGRWVARWFDFKPIWVNFGRSLIGRRWYILWPFGLFYGHLAYFMAF
jgi:hypothetical protein